MEIRKSFSVIILIHEYQISYTITCVSHDNFIDTRQIENLYFTFFRLREGYVWRLHFFATD